MKNKASTKAEIAVLIIKYIYNNTFRIRSDD